jgi:hypothetical protein
MFKLIDINICIEQHHYYYFHSVFSEVPGKAGKLFSASLIISANLAVFLEDCLTSVDVESFYFLLKFLGPFPFLWLSLVSITYSD